MQRKERQESLLLPFGACLTPDPERVTRHRSLPCQRRRLSSHAPMRSLINADLLGIRVCRVSDSRRLVGRSSSPTSIVSTQLIATIRRAHVIELTRCVTAIGYNLELSTPSCRQNASFTCEALCESLWVYYFITRYHLCGVAKNDPARKDATVNNRYGWRTTPPGCINRIRRTKTRVPA
jgi:hypothetical protein